MADLKVGIIGCGRISPFHGVPASSQENVTVVACCDLVAERATEKAALFGCERTYADYMEMIQAEELDVVHICLPHYLHPPVAIAAMKAGCHVLTEKPMSIDLADGEAMVATAKQTGRTLGVIFQNRYNAGSVLIKNALEHGSLGKILAAKATLTWYRADEYYSSSDWKGTWEKEGGGVIIDQAIHTFDLVRYFVDDEIDYIDCHIANREHPTVEVEDVADGIIAFKNGVKAAFWANNYYSHDDEVEIHISCENGTVKMVAEEARITYYDGREFIAKPNPAESFDYGGGPSYWGASHVKQIDQFYDALADGEEPEINGEIALETQRMVCAMYTSGKTNERIVL
ncbi:MAG: Gfo/Idh/MocA family oxidoreductase [Victivallales bacterium]|nr:Gfo/Idh/MocA family oxidoreductase [Victivallales bacterium]